MLSLRLAFCYNSCAYFPPFSVLWEHFEQGLSGHKSSTNGSGELINDSVPPKDPEEGGLLLPEPIIRCSNFSFPILNPLGENCEGNADPESLSDIDDVEVLSQ
jgi:transcription factor IIIB subunit 2